MLFDELSEYDHLVKEGDVSTAATLLQTVLADHNSYEQRLDHLRTSLQSAFNEAVVSMNESLASLTATLQLEESRAEEEAIRMKAQAAVQSSTPKTWTVSSDVTSEPFHMQGSTAKLTEFWKQKFGELQREVDLAVEKRQLAVTRLEDIQTSQNSSTAKTTKQITQLNEKIVSHKLLAAKFVKLLREMNDQTVLPDSTTGNSAIRAAEQAPWMKELSKEEEDGLKRVLDACMKEGEALHKLASFLTKRESVLKYKVHKLQQKVAMSNSDNALEDVLFLRAEVRGLKEQLEANRRTRSIAEESALQQQRESHQLSVTEQRVELESLRALVEELQRKVREVRVSIIRAEHKSHDGSQIVRRAVDEERVRALRDRLSIVEAEKLRELTLSHRASLDAQFDATLLAKAEKRL